MIAWVGEINVTLIDHERVFSMLSKLHIYCHGRQQENEQLNRDPGKNALELQQVLQEITVPTPFSRFS